MLPEIRAGPRRALRPHQDRGSAHRSRVDRRSRQRNTGPAKMGADRPAAAERARSLMHGIFVGEIQALEGAGRTCFDFDDETGAVRAQARHGPPVLGRGPPLRDLGEARRLDGHRDRRVRRVHVPLRGRVQPRPGPAPLRREPRARGPRHRRVQHDEGVRRRVGRPGARVLRGLDARRRGHPREDGLRLAAPPHRQRPRAPRAGARVPAHRRQALQPRRLPRRGRREPDPARPPLPRAGRLHRRRDRRDRRRSPASRPSRRARWPRWRRPRSPTSARSPGVREPSHRHARAVHARPVRRRPRSRRWSRRRPRWSGIPSDVDDRRSRSTRSCSRR